MSVAPEAAGRHEVKVAPRGLQGRFPGKVTSGDYILYCRLSYALTLITFIHDRAQGPPPRPRPTGHRRGLMGGRRAQRHGVPSTAPPGV